MKKFILTGTSNNGIRHRYSVIKSEEFKEVFKRLLLDLGFDQRMVDELFLKNDPNDEELKIKASIFDYNDYCDYFSNGKYELDVFYGSKKIIVIIRTNQKTKRDRRFKMLDYIETNSNWKEVPRIEGENKKSKKPLLGKFKFKGEENLND